MNVRSSALTALLASLAVLVAPQAALSESSAQPAAAACPPRAVPATAFVDTTRSAHRLSIDCAAWWDVTQGRTATRFEPRTSVTRGQTAAMVARLLRGTDAAPGEVPSAGFGDTRGHLFEEDIDLLAALGIVEGVTPARFAPDQPIERAQMASVLARMFEHAYDAPLPPGSVPFEDVSPRSVHREAIGRLVEAGITTGTSATSYSPSVAVIRAQMASFLMRSTGVLVENGRAGAPAERPGPGDPYATRTRAAWVHLFDSTLKSRSRIRAMLDDLAAADATTVVAQVIRRQDAYYDSDVLPRTPDPGVGADFDVLATLLQEAHARGIEVHAWWAVAPTWHGAYDDLPAPQGWVYTEHGPDAPVGDRWVSRDADGDWSDYLDPGVPAVQDHVAAVVGELAERYPVDGIHLDYVRYESAEHGYNPTALARFRQEEEVTGTPAPGNGDWTRWRREQPDRLIARARGAIDAAGGDVELSAAVITWGDGPPTRDRAGFRQTQPFTRALQDWDGWVRRGDVDVVMPMNYFASESQNGSRWFSRWIAYERALAGSERTRVVPGIGGYLNPPDAALDQAHTAMAAADGAVVYSYQQPTQAGTAGMWQSLAETRWGYPPAR